MSSLSISQQASSQQVSSSVQRTKISSRSVRSSEVDSSSRLALGAESDYEVGRLGGPSPLCGLQGLSAGYEGDAFRPDPEEGGKSRSQRLKDIMADAESEMDAMLARSKEARNAAEAAGSGHASNAGDDICLPGRNSSLGQEDPEPKSDMERRINLRSKALQRGLPKYV